MATVGGNQYWRNVDAFSTPIRSICRKSKCWIMIWITWMTKLDPTVGYGYQEWPWPSIGISEIRFAVVRTSKCWMANRWPGLPSSIQTVGWLPTMEYTMLNVPIRFAAARNAKQARSRSAVDPQRNTYKQWAREVKRARSRSAVDLQRNSYKQWARKVQRARSRSAMLIIILLVWVTPPLDAYSLSTRITEQGTRRKATWL